MKAIDFITEWDKTHTSQPSYQDVIDWVKKEMINKACQWLRLATQCGVHPCSGNSFVEDFRKAMEK